VGTAANFALRPVEAQSHDRQTAAELDGLMPSILAKAFRGEL